MIKPEVLDALVAAGCTAEQIAAAVKADQAKTSGAARQARYRARKASRVTQSDVTSVTGVSPDKERSPTPPKEIKPLPASPIGSASPARDLDKISERLLDAAGLGDFRAERNPGLVSLAPILGLLDQGYDLERDVLPIVRDIARRGKRLSSWSYVVPAVIEQHQTRAAIPAKPTPAAVDWGARLAAWRKEGTWIAAWGPKPDQPGCRAPPELLAAA